MGLASRIGVTCEKTFCVCIVVAVILVTLLSITTVVMVASNTSMAETLKILFAG